VKARIEVYKSQEPGSTEWWIQVDLTTKYMGPFDTEKEAREAAHRFEKFLKHEDEPGYVTSDKRGK